MKKLLTILAILILVSCTTTKRTSKSSFNITTDSTETTTTQKGLSWSGTEFLLKNESSDLRTSTPMVLTVNGRDTVVFEKTVYLRNKTKESSTTISEVDTTRVDANFEFFQLEELQEDDILRRRFNTPTLIGILIIGLIIFNFLMDLGKRR